MKLTGAHEGDAGNVDLELFLYDIPENPSVDEEGLMLSVVNGSIGFSFLGSILVFEIPVPFEFLWW